MPIYMKIDAEVFDGGTLVCELLEVSHGILNNVSGSGGGGGVGKATFQPFTITRRADKASPDFYRLCGTGNHGTRVQIDFKTGNINRTYLTFILDFPILTKYELTSSGDIPVEQIDMIFSSVKMQSFDPKTGAPGHSVEFRL